MIEHNWQYILEASRQFLDAIRLNSGSVQRFDAAQSRAEAVYAANVGRAIGHPASNARVRLSRDPRRDGKRRDDAEVAGMFHALYANRPDVRLAALRLWRFFCREAVLRLLAPHTDSAERQDAISDLVCMGSAELAELETAINQLALATGNISLARVQAAPIPPMEVATRGFEVKAGRIADELSRLADLLELIANGEADDIRDGDGWQTRTDAGLLVARLQALLNYGDLDFADCDFPTLERLKSLWSSIKRLDFGDHSDRPKEYRGALFLPYELCPVEIAPGITIPNQKLRGPDEAYETLNVSPEERLLAADAARVVRRERGTSPRSRRLAIGALARLQNGPTATKRERWGRLPNELRQYAANLRGADESSRENAAVSDAPTTQDGPISACRWQYGGQILPGEMTPQEHRLASYLFKFKDQRDVTFNELMSNGIVGSDVDRTSDATIQKHGSKVTIWFRDRGVPLKVSSTTVHRTMALSTISSDEI
jgi:hypothetical protein